MEAGGHCRQAVVGLAVHDVRAVEVGVNVLDDARDPHLGDHVVVRVIVRNAGALRGLQPATHFHRATRDRGLGLRRPPAYDGHGAVPDEHRRHHPVAALAVQLTVRDVDRVLTQPLATKRHRLPEVLARERVVAAHHVGQWQGRGRREVPRLGGAPCFPGVQLPEAQEHRRGDGQHHQQVGDPVARSEQGGHAASVRGALSRLAASRRAGSRPRRTAR